MAKIFYTTPDQPRRGNKPKWTPQAVRHRRWILALAITNIVQLGLIILLLKCGK